MRGGIDTVYKVVKLKGQIRIEAVSPRYDVSRRYEQDNVRFESVLSSYRRIGNLADQS
jgi:hypothetical protein